MTRYRGTDRVTPGIYFEPRELRFNSIEEDGDLPGGADRVYYRVPVLAMLVMAPVLSLAYFMFLPVIGFVMFAAVAAEKVWQLVAEAVVAGGRVLRPSWQPARAFLARGAKRADAKEKAEEKADDEWAREAEREAAADDEER